MPKVYSIKNNGGNIQQNRSFSIDLSPRFVFFVLAILSLIFFGKEVVTTLLFVFFGFVIMAAIKPIVKWLKGKKVSRGVAISISYTVFILLFISLVISITLPFLNQLAELVAAIPSWLEQTLIQMKDITIWGYTIKADAVTKYVMDTVKSIPLQSNVKDIANFLSGIFKWVGFFITSMVFSIYLVSEHEKLEEYLLIRIVSKEERTRVAKLIKDTEEKIGKWILGQTAVCSITAFFTGVVLTVLGIPFALPLALFAGFMDFIPNLGPTLAGIMLSLVALLTVGLPKALILLVAFMLYQLIENTVLIPKIMGDVVGLKPIVILLGAIVFLIFFGVVGAFLAIPLMLILSILYDFYIDLQKIKAKSMV